MDMDGILYEEESFNGVTVKAATVRKLVELCLCHFDEKKDGDLQPFVKVFFHTYHWYMKTEELLHHFINIFDKGCDTGDTDLLANVVKAVKYWLDNYGSDFERNEDASSLLNILNTKIQSQNENGHTVSLNLNDWKDTKATLKTTYEPGSSEKSLNFNSMSGEGFGNLLVFLNWKNLIKIPIWEWSIYGKKAKTTNTPFLKDQIGLFNDISKYVMGMILNNKTAHSRAQSMHKFVDAAKRAHELRDYNTFLAVMGGLGHSTIYRLRKTKEYLSQEDKLFIKESHEFLTSDNNYSKYRSYTENEKGFIIPILGVIMKDLVALETAVADYIEQDDFKMINFHKMVQVSGILEQIVKAYKTHPDVCPRKDLYNIFRVSIKSPYTEDALYELSLEREPRKESVPTLPRSSVSGNTLFAEWASGVIDTVPNRETVENHVKQMVDVVFQTYDVDQNNSLCKEEFDALATNFSFIDSFAVLDVNSDGNISRQEMINYFMNANSQEMTKEFLHDFQEQSYFSPHNCVYCTGFLWGIGKAGYRCKVCQISCHKECKDRVVLECRPNKTLSLRVEKSRKGIMKRIKTLDKEYREWKGSNDSQISVDSDIGSSPRTPRSICNGDVFSPAYESTETLSNGRMKELIAKLELDNENLRKENKELKEKRTVNESLIENLQNQLNLVRKQAISFMLEQMERLHTSKETDV